MKLSDFDYDLPGELIAQYPCQRREESRMILIDRARDEVRETRFANFPRYLREGDLLVVNDTKVIPARLPCRRQSGARIEVFLVRRLGERRWLALLRPSRRVDAGERLLLGAGGPALTIAAESGGGQWEVVLPEGIGEMRLIERFGRVPLPPYIKREDEELDRHRYQTIYARVAGSVAAPTAGLHFSSEIMQRIRSRGVTVMPLTLHVGPGTFRPLADETIERNRLESEELMIRSEHLDEIRSARGQGRRVVAVGTTVTRALEAAAAGLVEGGTVTLEGSRYLAGRTGLFIHPGWKFRVVDVLLTNMHLPRSSLLLLTAAFAGRERVLGAYRWAVSRRFRFYSYGDVMFIR